MSETRRQLERWQALLIERLREWQSPPEIVWLDAQLKRVAWMLGLRHRAITEAAHGITLLARSSSNMRKNISSVSTASRNP
jgi:hypothetical protein